MSYWAKLAGNYFANRKIRKAGSDGAYVFTFVLTQNAARGALGFIPISDLDPWYVADQLMISEERARAGIERAIAADLIQQCHGSYAIVGWDDDWARMPLSDAERAKRYRERQRHENVTASVTNVTPSNDNVTTVTERVTRHVEEKRREDREEREEKTKPPAAPMGGDLVLVEPTKPKPGRPKKPKASEPTPAELASVRVVLDKLGGHNGVRYSGSPAHAALIVRHLRSGLDEMDLRYVVLHCAEELDWKSKPNMRHYLRPETLFGPDTIAKYIDAARTLRAEREAAKPVEYGKAYDEPAWMNTTSEAEPWG